MRYACTLLIAGILSASSATVSLAADAPANAATRTADSTTTQPAPQYWFGLAVENIPPAFAKLMKLKPDQGLIVLAVMHDSPAERAGLLPDDLLIEINGALLTSQLDLARAANSPPARLPAATPPAATPPASIIKYCRDGDFLTASIQPAPRPANMRISGGNLPSFSLSARKTALQPDDLKPLNYVLPNGTAAQVGPGYHINLNSPDFAAKSIREVVAKGQTLILSQETDAAGITHNTITVGEKIYTIDPAQLDTLPPDLRPLAQQLLVSPPAPQQPIASPTPQSPDEKRITELEQANQSIQKRLDDATAQLKKMQPPPAQPGN